MPVRSVSRASAEVVSEPSVHGDPTTAEVVRLRQAGHSWRVIGARLGLSPSTARSRHQAAAGRLGPRQSRPQWRHRLDEEWTDRWQEVRRHRAARHEWPRLPSADDPEARVLARWIARQRKLYRRGALRADRERALLSAGLRLDPQLGRPPGLTRAAARPGAG